MLFYKQSINLDSPDIFIVVIKLISAMRAHFYVFSVIAIDEQGVNSPELSVIIVLCSGCSDHGTCNFTKVRPDSTAEFKYATCECEPYWTGGIILFVLCLGFEVLFFTTLAAYLNLF